MSFTNTYDPDAIHHDNNKNTATHEGVRGGGEEEYVNVNAPSNLPGGYELNVDLNGTAYTVQVVSHTIYSALILFLSGV
jgi:hypothetical protein